MLLIICIVDGRNSMTLVERFHGCALQCRRRCRKLNFGSYPDAPSVDYGQMAEILVQRAGSPDEFTRLTAITWINEFVKLGGDQLVPYYVDILGAILPTLLWLMYKVARETNEKLRAIKVDPADAFDVGAICPLLGAVRRNFQNTRKSSKVADESMFEAGKGVELFGDDRGRRQHGEVSWDALKRKVEQIAEEAESLRASLDKCNLWHQKRMRVANERAELLGRAYMYEAIKSDDIATLVYTSGTTGNPKGVMLTHQNLLHQDVLIFVQSIENYVELDYCSYVGDKFLSMLPSWHAYERASEYFIFSCGVEQVYTTVRKLKGDDPSSEALDAETNIEKLELSDVERQFPRKLTWLHLVRALSANDVGLWVTFDLFKGLHALGFVTFGG
ncbi:hypothetical protein V8G54_021435 [Vigna mungo]|uniref:AMP-dependent synthetase/ligase domain-containing protein n=1 Tax=Vigna mungo TaxID=3915 RepID=A0AAQ3RXC7_VIGMU